MTNFNFLLNTTKIVTIEKKLDIIKQKIFNLKSNKREPVKELEVERLLYRISKYTNELEELIDKMKGNK